METKKIEPFMNEFLTYSELVPDYLYSLNKDYDGFKAVVAEDSLLYFLKLKHSEFRTKYHFKATIFLNRFRFKDRFLKKQGVLQFSMDLFDFQQILDMYRLLKHIFLDEEVTLEWETFK